MKTAKRLLAVLLLALMCFSVFAACDGGGPKPTPGPDTSGRVTGPLLPRPVEEMSGKEFIIIQHDEEINPFGYKENSQNAIKALARVEEVEGLYGCTLSFRVLAYDTTNFATQFQALAYETNSGDLMFGTNNASMRTTLGVGGSVSQMEDLLQYDDIIDFWNTEKWGNITAKETMMAGGIFYGVTPALWIGYLPAPFYDLVYSKNLVERFGQTDPQEYYEQGNWNRDNMIDLMMACYDNTGSETIFGLKAELMHMIRATVMAAGVDAVTINSISEDGTADWTNGWLTPEAEEAMSWLQRVLNNSDDRLDISPTVTWRSHEGMVNGTAATVLTSPGIVLNSIAVIEDSDFHFGLVPWAGSDSNIISGFYENVCSVSIPIFAQNGRWSAFLMADLFEGLDEQTSTYDGVIAYYRNTYFENDLDFQFWSGELANNLQYSYWPNGGDRVLTSIYPYFRQYTAAQLQQAYGAMADSVLADYIVPNKIALQKYMDEGKIQ